MAQGTVLAGAPGDRALRATVAYDGTDFCGFQVQDGVRTVQGALEQALARVTQEPVRVIGAGRTDSGVHALGQVVAFGTRWRHPVQDLHRALNAVLPEDIAVLALESTEAEFHPRFDAKSRTYRYVVWNHRVRNPLERRTTYWVPQPIDESLIASAAEALVGEHDFATFGTPPQGENTVREVLRVGCSREGERVLFDIEANAFLYRMVRSIVGTLLQVGTGKMTVAHFGEVFAAADRALAGPTAPAAGLCLVSVNY